MIKITNLGKIYKSKSGNDVYALKNVSFQIQDKGFICVLGKSGSGKSTLLNLIGTLDAIEHGDIIISDNSFKSLTKNQLDNYRAKHIGFVFQDYNLLETMTVKQNVSLPLYMLKIPRDEIEQKVDKILSEFELEDLKNRYISELSGGQKQRVALARAVVKDPLIILADEPTGNLDSETSMIVFNYLKKVSRERLVIMVTHDAEYANKYADKIIELKDGQIINEIDINIQEKKININDNVTEGFNYKIKFPLSMIMRMAISSVFTKKFRLFLLTILFVMSLVFLSVSTILANYNIAKSTNKSFKLNDINSFTFSYLNLCDNCYNEKIQLVNDIKKFNQNHSDISVLEVLDKYTTFYDLSSNFSSKDAPEFYRPQIEKIVYYDDLPTKLSFVAGGSTSASNGIIITDYIAEMFMFYGVIDGTQYQDIIGKTFFYYGLNKKIPFKIEGIIDTDYEKYVNINEKISDQIRDEFHYDYFEEYSMVYLNRKNLQYIKNEMLSKKLLLKDSTNQLFTNWISRFPESINSHNHLLYGSIPSKNHEVIITLSTVLEKEGITLEKFYSEQDDILTKYLGMQTTFTIDDNPNEFNFIITGIINNLTEELEGYSSDHLFVSDYSFDTLFDEAEKMVKRRGKVLLDDNDFSNVKFLNDFYSTNYRHETKISIQLYDFIEFIQKVNKILLTISIVFGIFTGLLIFTFISSSIQFKQKDIGILRSLGISGGDCSKIFVIESMIINLFVNLCSIIITRLIISEANYQINKYIGTKIAYLYLDIVSIVVTIIFSITLTILSSYFPVKRIANMRPIDAIKN